MSRLALICTLLALAVVARAQFCNSGVTCEAPSPSADPTPLPPSDNPTPTQFPSVSNAPLIQKIMVTFDCVPGTSGFCADDMTCQWISDNVGSGWVVCDDNSDSDKYSEEDGKFTALLYALVDTVNDTQADADFAMLQASSDYTSNAGSATLTKRVLYSTLFNGPAEFCDAGPTCSKPPAPTRAPPSEDPTPTFVPAPSQDPMIRTIEVEFNCPGFCPEDMNCPWIANNVGVEWLVCNSESDSDHYDSGANGGVFKAYLGASIDEVSEAEAAEALAMLQDSEAYMDHGVSATPRVEDASSLFSGASASVVSMALTLAVVAVAALLA